MVEYEVQKFLLKPLEIEPDHPDDFKLVILREDLGTNVPSQINFGTNNINNQGIMAFETKIDNGLFKERMRIHTNGNVGHDEFKNLNIKKT
jgi:hypothetical protein